MSPHALIVVRTERRRYALRRDDVLTLQVASDGALPRDPDGTQPLVAELAALIGSPEHSARRRQHALIVQLRRQRVALLVSEVLSFVHAAEVAPLPPLIAARRYREWAIGVVSYEGALIVALDARVVARGAVLARSNIH